MHPGYHIRAARPDDLHSLPDIERQAGKLFAEAGLGSLFMTDVMALEDLRAYSEAGRLWVAVTEDDTPVGFACTSIFEGQAHLNEVDVHPDHGRRGIGRALVECVCAWACERGLPAITLTTQRNVPWNAPFYARLGFSVLDPAAWTDDLRAVMAHEAALGLDMKERVVMIRYLLAQPE